MLLNHNNSYLISDKVFCLRFVFVIIYSSVKKVKKHHSLLQFFFIFFCNFIFSQNEMNLTLVVISGTPHHGLEQIYFSKSENSDDISEVKLSEFIEKNSLCDTTSVQTFFASKNNFLSPRKRENRKHCSFSYTTTESYKTERETKTLNCTCLVSSPIFPYEPNPIDPKNKYTSYNISSSSTSFENTKLKKHDVKLINNDYLKICFQKEINIKTTASFFLEKKIERKLFLKPFNRPPPLKTGIKCSLLNVLNVLNA